MAALQLPAVGLFFVLSDTATLGQGRVKRVKIFEYFLVASNVKDKKRQRAMFLRLAGLEVQDVFETLIESVKIIIMILQLRSCMPTLNL